MPHYHYTFSTDQPLTDETMESLEVDLENVVREKLEDSTLDLRVYGRAFEEIEGDS